MKKEAPNWLKIRAAWELGATDRDLAKKYRISHVAIYNRSKKEGWARDSAGLINRRVNERLTGVTTEIISNDTEEFLTTKAQAIEDKAARRAEIIIKHCLEIVRIKNLLQTGVEQFEKSRSKKDRAETTEKIKASKIAAETLRILQGLERMAWNIGETAEVDAALEFREFFARLEGKPLGKVG